MFVISEANLKALEQVSTEAFFKRTDDHLRQWFPHHCECIVKNQMRDIVRHGWEKANSYNFTSEACVRSYLEFMFLLGHEFDADSLLPWASHALTDKNHDSEIERGDALHSEAWAYVRSVSQDVQRLVKRQPPPSDGAVLNKHNLPAFIQYLKAQFQNHFPAKCAYLTLPTLVSAVSESVQSALAHGINTERGIEMFATKRFALGVGFFNDPTLPWVSSALGNSASPDPNMRVRNLYKDAIAFLARSWNLSDRERPI